MTVLMALFVVAAVLFAACVGDALAGQDGGGCMAISLVLILLGAAVFIWVQPS